MFYKDGKVYSEYELRGVFKEVSFPSGIVDDAFAEQEGFSKVAYGEVPIIDEAIQKVILNEVPTLVNGIYVLEYMVIGKTEDEIREYIKAQIPQMLTPLQAKLQLLDMELLDEVEAMVSTDRKVQLYWEYASVIERNHPTLVAMATTLGLTDEQLDEMFIEASKLS